MYKRQKGGRGRGVWTWHKGQLNEATLYGSVSQPFRVEGAPTTKINQKLPYLWGNFKCSSLHQTIYLSFLYIFVQWSVLAHI